MYVLLFDTFLILWSLLKESETVFINLSQINIPPLLIKYYVFHWDVTYLMEFNWNWPVLLCNFCWKCFFLMNQNLWNSPLSSEEIKSVMFDLTQNLNSSRDKGMIYECPISIYQKKTMYFELWILNMICIKIIIMSYKLIQ